MRHLRLLILHGARRRVQYYLGDASDGHPGAPEQIRHPLSAVTTTLVLTSPPGDS